MQQSHERIEPSPPGLDLARLATWMTDVLGVEIDDPLRAELIVGGRSNLTYLIATGTSRWVLRRPPLGRRLPTAHNMSREVQVIRALAGSAVPVPGIVGECVDDAVIGAPFYVMQFVDGRVIRTADDLDPDWRHPASIALTNTLARLHRIDYERIGLASLGRPEGYVERQVTRWQEQLDRSRVRELPILDQLGRQLAASIPASTAAGIVHGDYRLDNVILSPGRPDSIAAVVDWEMATLGDPRCDLGMLLMYWGEPGERFATPIHAITSAPGFPARDEVVDAYSREAGTEPSDLAFFVALAYYKLAVIVEGIHARYLDGLTVGEGYEQMSSATPILAEQGMEALI